MLIYNTLIRQKEEFVPINSNKVNMYVCGITPYNHCHIGHGRCYVVFDVIRRYLKYKKYNVEYVQNFTDIDDKIINAANAENIPALELADRYIKSYFEALNVLPADKYPRVSTSIQDIIKTIEKIIQNDFAYVIDGEVFFDVRKFNGYGKLSNRVVEEQKAGARVKTDEKKRHPLDFTLWKPAKPGEPSWPSPWSEGRPGWHIECSAMSLAQFGGTFDIHGGGQDLIFPHHENEIAQSEAAVSKQFVKYWMHNGFVTVNKEKMSKSLDNFFLIKDILKQYKPEILRYFLLTSHYRSPIDFSESQLLAAKTAVVKLKNFLFELQNAKKIHDDSDIEKEYKNIVDEFEKLFVAAMDDDFNTGEAIGNIHIFIHKILKKILESGISKNSKNIIECAFNSKMELLGLKIIPQKTEEEGKTEKLLELIIKIRQNARAEKNYQLSDFIRNGLAELGIEIRDTKEGAKAVII